MSTWLRAIELARPLALLCAFAIGSAHLGWTTRPTPSSSHLSHELLPDDRARDGVRAPDEADTAPDVTYSAGGP